MGGRRGGEVGRWRKFINGRKKGGGEVGRWRKFINGRKKGGGGREVEEVY